MKTNLQYRPELYLGESISDAKLDKIKAKIAKHPLWCSAYLLVISRNVNDQLEILQARQLGQAYYRKISLDVIGVASDYDEAVALVEKIVQECLRSRGDCALKEYLSC